MQGAENINSLLNLVHPSWRQIFEVEFAKEYFQKLSSFVNQERTEFEIFPPKDLVFRAFNKTPLEDVRAVIIGQDPYHEPEQACGLAFSVPENVRVPPSLRNIYKELSVEFGKDFSKRTGDISSWSEQGVLLLNATLTVRSGNAGSHQNRGWEIFTDFCISKLSQVRSNLVFFLWGAFAQKKISLIDTTKHLVLCAAHPSPLSAYRGFFGCGHFKKANEYLVGHGFHEINW